MICPPHQGEEEEEGDYEDAYDDENDVLDSAGEDELEDQVSGPPLLLFVQLLSPHLCASLGLSHAEHLRCESL